MKRVAALALFLLPFLLPFLLLAPAARAHEIEEVQIQLIFASGSPEMAEDHTGVLAALAQKLRTGEERLVLHSIASETEAGDGFSARALALERALQVRRWLVRRGAIAQRRIIIKPAAAALGEGRIDILILPP